MPSAKTYVKPLLVGLREAADSAQAPAMKKYMRDQFEYLGIKAPARRSVVNTFLKEHGNPDAASMDDVMRSLWSQPEREYQYAAVDIIEKGTSVLLPRHLELCEYMICTKSWWDTVDGVAINVVGAICRRHPAHGRRFIKSWRSSDDFWLRRTTLLFQLKYRDETDWDLLTSLIRENLGSKEFFINKAIGWALREHSKTDSDRVVRFVESTALAPLSRREALKWPKLK